MDEFNKNGKNKPSENLGRKYFELIETSDLSETEKERAKHELKEVIHSIHKGEIVGFRMKIKGIHKLAYGGQEGGRNNQIKNNGFTINH